jgi:hypothetical protein
LPSLSCQLPSRHCPLPSLRCFIIMPGVLWGGVSLRCLHSGLHQCFGRQRSYALLLLALLLSLWS